MDATAENVELYDGKTEIGIGKGFSAFMGLSEINTIWIASLNDTNQIVDVKLVYFEKGDCLIIPYGVLHAGDKNRTEDSSCTYKLFTDVSSERATDSTSQLWVIPGKGYTRTKKPYQLLDDGHTYDVVNLPQKKRKRNS